MCSLGCLKVFIGISSVLVSLIGIAGIIVVSIGVNDLAMYTGSIHHYLYILKWFLFLFFQIRFLIKINSLIQKEFNRIFHICFSNWSFRNNWKLEKKCLLINDLRSKYNLIHFLKNFLIDLKNNKLKH